MKQTKQEYIYGRHPVIDAIKAGATLEKIFLQQGIRGPFEKELRQLSKEYNIPIQYVPKERMNKMTHANHQGVIGLMALLQYYRLEDVLGNIFESGDPPLLLILDGVTDVRNIGAIARSAEVMGVQALITPIKNTAQLNAEAIKTSAGALTRLAVCREPSLVNALKMIQLNGIQVVATTLEEAEPLYDLDLGLPTAIVMGSEDEGVNPAVVRLANARCKIPQVGQTDSLNVSVATGIVLYEVIRQRLK